MTSLQVKESCERIEMRMQEIELLNTLENARSMLRILFEQHMPNTDKEFYLKDLDNAIIRMKETL